jgi:GNAT superfamily N-acetyltransferase
VTDGIETRSVPAGDPVVATLLAAFEAELDEVYDGFDPAAGPSAAPADFRAPAGAFVVIWEDGTPIAGGGVKRHTPDCGEIKRMYVTPEARSRGYARRLLGALEDAARELGYRRVRLDTGPRQPHAQALYGSAGYAEIPDYNGNPYASFWFEKQLDKDNE